MEPEKSYFSAQVANHAGAYYTPNMADELDDWEDYVLEAIREGHFDEAKKLIAEQVKATSDARVMDALSRTLSHIVDAKDPRYQADLFAYCSRLRLREGWTSATIAEKYGKSRTIVRADVNGICSLLDLPAPEKRDVSEQQSGSNFRPQNHDA